MPDAHPLGPFVRRFLLEAWSRIAIGAAIRRKATEMPSACSYDLSPSVRASSPRA